MTHEQIAIAGLLAAQAATLYLLWLTKEDADQWREAWLRDATELLYWKRHGLMRDPKTGRYVKKDKRNG
jgi:hypothetical protein